MNDRTSATPVNSFTFVKMKGHSPRIRNESRCITTRLAPTSGARSILLITKKSDFVIPGPPFLGILSPAETSLAQIVMLHCRAGLTTFPFGYILKRFSVQHSMCSVAFHSERSVVQSHGKGLSRSGRFLERTTDHNITLWWSPISILAS
jgi:hypothetical protein